MLYSLLDAQTKSLLIVLFWGNLVAIALVLSYRFTHNSRRYNTIAARLTIAKICQAAAYFCLFFRGTFPDVVSVNIGNSLLFVGFYQEAVAMLVVIKESNKYPFIFLGVVLACTLIIFNGIELAYPHFSIRVVTASIAAFVIFAMPAVKMLAGRSISYFKRIVGLLYFGLITLLLPRAYFAQFGEINVLSDSFIQSLTFLALILITLYGFSACLLLMKEESDNYISDLASKDTLTNLANRHSFLENAERHFARCKRAGGTLAVLFLDIDYFKKINDTYGHPFGDSVLVALADVIRQSLRAGDLSCRYGGEEFVLLINDADTAEAMAAASRITAGAAARVFPDQPEFSFTVSIGVMAGKPAQDHSLMDFISFADKALYAAKAAGRNRIVGYEPA
jgi:diguanylate cyclase (GGDEF)-like protein